MTTRSRLMLPLFALLLAIPAILSATPAPPAAHPAYLHALSDLRHARAHLHVPGSGSRTEHEEQAIREIDEAINEIKKSSIDDGKDLNDHPPVDSKLDRAGRLHRALELVDKAHRDVSEEEDDRFAQGLQQRALLHIDRAHNYIKEAIEARP
ncbi:MAG TPA: hypothetical protein VK525_00930 [Candidatus Saccharimonadales bacterium]|nr:hypothetical protein [Candidatus Saccharimonadales bacterium]